MDPPASSSSLMDIEEPMDSMEEEEERRVEHAGVVVIKEVDVVISNTTTNGNEMEAEGGTTTTPEELQSDAGETGDDDDDDDGNQQLAVRSPLLSFHRMSNTEIEQAVSQIEIGPIRPHDVEVVGINKVINLKINDDEAPQMIGRKARTTIEGNVPFPKPPRGAARISGTSAKDNLRVQPKGDVRQRQQGGAGAIANASFVYRGTLSSLSSSCSSLSSFSSSTSSNPDSGMDIDDNSSNSIPPPQPSTSAAAVTSESKRQHENQQLPPPPQVVCADGKSACMLNGSSVFPCDRCHKEFYCSEQHRKDNKERHDAQDCRTKSNLLVHSMDKEYQMWLNHAAPTCYDVYLNFLLVWSSLTVEWMPKLEELEGDIESYELLIGTYTNGETNHLLLCGVDIPNLDPENLNDEAGVACFVRYDGSFYVKKRIVHQGEINRARFMPQSTNIIATKSPSNDVFIFDLDKYPEIPENDEFKPRLRLTGHTKDGYGIAWNPMESGFLLSGSNDNVVCLWDINHLNKDEKTLKPVSVFTHHTGAVEDVDWHTDNPKIAVSVGADKKIVIWDTRYGSGSNNNSVFSNDKGHSAEINCVKFSPFSENCFVTGSSDQTVALWDLRNFSSKVHSFENHRDEVMQVQWSPHSENMFASASKDKRVFVWHLEKIGKTEELTSRHRQMPASGPNDNSDDVPPELHFIHGGHVSAINDISWNPHDAGMIASVCDDNTLQLWQISEDILFGSESSEIDGESEYKSELD